MKGRMLASVVMTAIGASLLAAAMFASTASGAGAGSATATAKKGGSLVVHGWTMAEDLVKLGARPIV